MNDGLAEPDLTGRTACRVQAWPMLPERTAITVWATIGCVSDEQGREQCQKADDQPITNADSPWYFRRGKIDLP